jgi:NarL family two-component system response regulator LiaR
VTQSLKAWLESFPDMVVVGIASNGEEALAKILDWQPDVVLQDLLMPGGIDGIETTARIRALCPSARVVALTASLDEPRMMGVLRAGAAGYIRKNAEPETLLAAVRSVAQGRTFIDPDLAQVLAAACDTPSETLTPRETDVLRLVALGRSNRDIATSLGVGEETIKTHVSRVLAKLQVENRAQAIVEALRRRLVSIDEL